MVFFDTLQIFVLQDLLLFDFFLSLYSSFVLLLSEIYELFLVCARGDRVVAAGEILASFVDALG